MYTPQRTSQAEESIKIWMAVVENQQNGSYRWELTNFKRITLDFFFFKEQNLTAENFKQARHAFESPKENV